MRRNWPVLLLLGLLPGCLTAEFSTVRVAQPPTTEAMDEVRPGMNLTDTLALLGAPTSVRRDDEGHRTVMSWEWFRAGGFGLSLSVPLGKQASASVDYGTDAQNSRQFQVFFDQDFRVERVSRERAR